MTVAEYNLCVKEFADRLYHFILKNIRDDEVAKDIIQDTYEKFWIRHDQVTFSKSRSYLFTAAYHTMIDYMRKKMNLTLVDEPAEIESGFNSAEPDLKESLNWALSKIPQIQRSVILLRDYEGYSYEEIGEITNLSESQVKVYIYRGRLALRKLIGNPEVLI
ncbi:MAG: RNA polymerase sigma factor [Bacteroidales bacterium]|nr:RNA polymerase sigma factor [Bacteroidales bacterium]